MQDFAQPNILMRFSFKEDEQVMFVYSNLNGLEHMKQVIEDNSLFSNLLTPKDIFNKLSDVISYGFFGNKYNGVAACEWSGKNVWVTPDDADNFFKQFDTWIAQLEKFVGKENLVKISMTQNEFERLEDLPSDIEQNIYFINFLEAYRLNKHLDKTLPDKKHLGKNKKI